MLICCAFRILAQSDSTPPAEDSKVLTMRGTYYADRFVGHKTSNGEVFRQNQYTAAHRTLPFGTYLLVTNPRNGLQVVVRVNDRCPVRGVLDMTKIATYALGMRGTQNVEVRTLAPTMGEYLWGRQDTTALTAEAHLAFRDKSRHKRISPYEQKTIDEKPPSFRKSSPAVLDNKPAEKPADTAVATAAKPIVVRSRPAVVITSEPLPPSEPGTPPDTAVIQRYDIELCTVGSNKSALREINQLPKELQEKVTLHYNQYNRQVRIIISLNCLRSEAVRTLAQIADNYPESIIIPTSSR